jgi:rare lipoprotein A (peptidoglycan hydrolase)
LRLFRVERLLLATCAIIVNLLAFASPALAYPQSISCYGAESTGITASGDYFDGSSLTAAHPWYPFGTVLRLTHNGHSVDVVVNDRSPYPDTWDASWEACSRIDMLSVGRDVVDVKVLDMPDPLSLSVRCAGEESGNGGGGRGDPPSEAKDQGMKTIRIVEMEHKQKPTEITLNRPTICAFEAVNSGSVAHTLAVRVAGSKQKTAEIQPGQDAQLRVKLEAGSYKLYRPVSGHGEGTINVEKVSASWLQSPGEAHGVVANERPVEHHLRDCLNGAVRNSPASDLDTPTRNINGWVKEGVFASCREPLQVPSGLFGSFLTNVLGSIFRAAGR